MMMSLRIDEAARVHAFFNDHRPRVYNAAPAADAWSKTIDFFRRELRP
jgi:carboxymethylenebutenolidase